MTLDPSLSSGQAPTLSTALSDRYTFERELGHGGMATVYLARDLKHDREVALKVVKPELSAALASRFSREIRVAARLQHPHICSVYDSGETADGQLWYTMPFVRGMSLRDRMVRDRKMPIAESVRIIREAAQALEYAHKQGVIHRDIKPENILLTEDGNTLVADFGIAKMTEANTQSGATQLTETGFAIGTPAYMSPEQRLGAPVDARSDVYSLAATLYEMLLDELPPNASGGLEMFLAQMTGPTPSLSIKRSDITPALEQVLRKGINVDLEQRYPSMAAFQQALEAVVSGNFSAARPAAVAIPWRRAGVLLAVVALVAGAAWSWRHWRGGPRVTTIALLPFTTAPGDSLLKDIAWDFTEDLRRILRHVPGYDATSEAATQRFTGGRLTAKQIAAGLGAGVVVLGDAARTGDGYTLSFAVSRPDRSAEVKRATISGTLQQLVDWRDSITTTVLRLAGDTPDPEVVKAAGRARIATTVAAAYAKYATVMRQNNSGSRTDEASLLELLAREDTLLILDPNFIDALSDRGMFGLLVTQSYQHQLTPAEYSAQIQRTTDLLRQAQALDPNHPLTNRLAGYLLLNNGDTAGALEKFRAVVADEPVFQTLADLCGVEIVKTRPPAPIPSSCQRLVASDSLNPLALGSASYLFYDNNRFDEALATARTAIQIEPAVPMHHADAYWALRALNRYPEALQEARQTVVLDPGNPESHRVLAALLQQLERPGEALTEAEAMVAIVPRDQRALAFLSGAQVGAGKVADGLATARKVVSLYPATSSAHLLLGERLWDARQFDAALKEYQQAVSLEPHTAIYRTYQLSVQMLAGRMGDAQATLDQITAMGNGDVAGVKANVWLTRWLGKMDETVVLSRRIALSDTTDPAPWAALAYADALAGHPDSAKVHAERAIALNSTQSDAWSNLALAEAMLGHQAAAIAAVDAMRRTSPWTQDALAQQVWFYARGGRTAEAAVKLDSLERRYKQYGPSLLPLILAYAGVRDTVKARQALSASIAARDVGWLNYSLDDPLFADLRGTAEFVEAKKAFLQAGDQKQ